MMTNPKSETEGSEQFNTQKALSHINETFVQKGASSITANDVDKVHLAYEEIIEKLSKPGPLHEYSDDLQLALALIDDHRNFRFKDVSYWAVAIITFALVYIQSPIDLIPDSVPNVGQIDDAAVVSLCLEMTEKERATYHQWKSQQS